MAEATLPPVEFDHEDFDFETLEEELQITQRCQALLNAFYHHLQERGLSAEKASELAYSADYYVRDYLVDFQRMNVLRPEPGIVRRFAGSWYITTTVDPEAGVLERHLEAVREFYRFLAAGGSIAKEDLLYLENECAMMDFYRRRIDSFLAIEGDGYVAWQAECPAR